MPSAAPERPERKPMREASNAPSIISADVKITGNLLSPGELQFDGQMEGDITCGSLTVGERAEIEGTLTANRVIVHGTVKGSIRARSVHLHSTSKLSGDVVHEDLTIDSGAFIDGRCLHVSNPLESNKGGQSVHTPAPAPKAEAHTEKPGDPKPAAKISA